MVCVRSARLQGVPDLRWPAAAGVKYLHHEAKVFDIGIYFEANGHGTVLFKPSLLQRLQDMDEHVRCCCCCSAWVA